MIFHNFSGGGWKILAGNILMLITCLCYVSWWTTAFRPGRTGGHGLATVLLTLTLAAGIGSLALLAGGIGELTQTGAVVPLPFIPAAAVVLYIVLLILTKQMFHRVVTSELLIMIIWAAFELAALNALTGNADLPATAAVIQLILIAAATAAGLVCYILYYRLDGMAGFIDGLVPLAADGLVVAIFLVLQLAA